MCANFESFQKANKPISVCGEMAGNPKGAALLVGLGARKLSMNAAMLAAVKAELARHRIDELEKMAKTCQELFYEKKNSKQMSGWFIDPYSYSDDFGNIFGRGVYRGH